MKLCGGCAKTLIGYIALKGGATVNLLAYGCENNGTCDLDFFEEAICNLCDNLRAENKGERLCTD